MQTCLPWDEVMALVSIGCSACLLSNGEDFVCKSRTCFSASSCNRRSMPVCLDAPRGTSKTAWVCLSLLLHTEISVAHSKSLHLHCSVVVVVIIIVAVVVIVVVVVVVVLFIMMMQQSHAS